VKPSTDISGGGEIAIGGFSVRGLPDLERLRRWAPSGLLALLDQGLISGSNFVVGVCLARWAGPESYGAYMLMFAAFLLVANVHQALVLEPANVLAFSLFPDRHDRYLRAVLQLHAIFTVGFVSLGGIAMLVAPHWHIDARLGNALAGLVIATPCVLLFWLARSFAYLEFAPGAAVNGSAVYCGVLAASIVGMWLLGGLTPMRVFACTAAAAVAASVRLLLARLPWGSAFAGEPTLGQVWIRHWRFGRWGLGSVAMSWAQTNSISFISGSMLGLRQVGGLNALVALMLPMYQVLTSATRVSLPRIAQIFTLHGVAGTKRPVLRVGVVLVILTAGYALCISVLHNPIFQHLYGARFMPYAWLAPIISIHVVGWGAITACDIAFNSIQRPQASFRIKVLMVLIMVPVNTALIWRFGLLGAAIGAPAMSTLTACLMALKLRAVWQEEAAKL
jgi:O-antigen/teichoic acid export membrane protein